MLIDLAGRAVAVIENSGNKEHKLCGWAGYLLLSMLENSGKEH